MELIKLIEQERIRQGLTQTAIAHVAGLSQAYYSQIVDGTKDGLTLKAFLLMAEKLNLGLALTVRVDREESI